MWQERKDMDGTQRRVAVLGSTGSFGRQTLDTVASYPELFVVSVFPNPRLSLSVLSLLGILSFSLTGFSFPVQSMYGALAIFSYAIPVRYLFLIYVSDVLNGWPIYYVRLYYVALILFVPIGCTLAWRLKKACLKPVYVP